MVATTKPGAVALPARQGAADSAPRPETTSTLTAVGDLLSRRLGFDVDLDDPEDLGGSGRTQVLRIRIPHSSPALPRTVVVKRLHTADRSDADLLEAFSREAAAYKFATALAVDSRPGPQLLASDAERKILVLSDLGIGETMTERLGRTPPAGVPIVLSAWAQALGRMHAATYGRERDLCTLARREHTDARRDPVAVEVAAAVRALPGRIGYHDPSALAELARGAALFTEGRFRAFSPSDVGPDNTMVVGGAVKFLDYEWAGFRDAVLDVGYGLATYPNCVTGGATADLDTTFAEAWRSEVVRVRPGLADDRVLRRYLGTAYLTWMALATYWALGGADDPSGMDSGHLTSLDSLTPADLARRWERLGESAPHLRSLATAAAAAVR
jgi:hypothetical protein